MMQSIFHKQSGSIPQSDRRVQRLPSVGRGMTTIELLVTLMIATMVLLALSNMFNIHWKSYRDTMAQNIVNQEARRALDDICDDIRNSGANYDVSAKPNVAGYQVLPASDSTQLGIGNTQNQQFWYRVVPSNGTKYLVRVDAGNQTAVARYIEAVEFEYEYRQKAQDDEMWSFVRTQMPNANAQKVITTIYVTVRASYTPLGETASFTRNLKSAVHLRLPYNAPVPQGL